MERGEKEQQKRKCSLSFLQQLLIIITYVWRQLCTGSNPPISTCTVVFEMKAFALFLGSPFVPTGFLFYFNTFPLVIASIGSFLSLRRACSSISLRPGQVYLQFPDTTPAGYFSLRKNLGPQSPRMAPKHEMGSTMMRTTHILRKKENGIEKKE